MKKRLFPMLAMVGLAMATTLLLSMLTACDDDDDDVDDLTETVDDDSSDSDSDDSSSDSSTSTTGTINGYEYVDLGLSVKWATINIGASGKYWAGSYFAWGEPTTKGTYKEDNSETYGINIDDISGNATYDAATDIWGSPWRMPTYDEMKELVDECTWTWVTNSYINGYLVESSNGNSIFLPAAGVAMKTGEYGKGDDGYYWTSTPKDDDEKAYDLFLYDTGYAVLTAYRYYGYQVRPVTD